MNIIKNLSEEIYHSQSDLTEPHFSASYAKTMVQKSAFHVYHSHPLLGGGESKDSDALSFGRGFHAVMSANFNDLVVVDEVTYKSKRAQETRDSIISEGKTPALIQSYNMRVAAENQLKEIMPCALEQHESELTIRYEVDGIKWQTRFDAYYEKYGLIIDWKSTTDASPAKCMYDIKKFRYDMQDIVYKSAGKFLTESPRFIFCFIEKDFPHAISLIELDDHELEYAKMDVYSANEQFRVCIENDKWPGYGYRGTEV